MNYLLSPLNVITPTQECMELLFACPEWARQEIHFYFSIEFKAQTKICCVQVLAVCPKMSPEEPLQLVQYISYSISGYPCSVNICERREQKYFQRYCKEESHGVLVFSPLEYSTRSKSKFPGMAVPCPSDPPFTISLTTMLCSLYRFCYRNRDSGQKLASLMNMLVYLT